MKPRELEQTIRTLLSQPQSDADLRTMLEELATKEKSFSGFTWLWGPDLYRRNRILFRPFILSHFSQFMWVPNWNHWNIEQIHWKGGKTAILDRWLAETDQNDDAELFRRLYEWKLGDKYSVNLFDRRAAEICRALLERFTAAKNAGERQAVLRKLDLWFDLKENDAMALYRIDPPAAGAYILRRLPTNWYANNAKRAIWTELLKLADERHDEDFRWKLYRRQIPIRDWISDILGLCDRLRDPAELVAALEKHHPEGAFVDLGKGMANLLQRRGRDVMPYIMRHLREVWTGVFTRGHFGELANYAAAQGWWDLWSALVRVCASEREFNQEVRALLENRELATEEIQRRLAALAGVSREWNWGGFGFATLHQLDDKLAVLFYERFPDLLRGPYKAHLQSHVWGEWFPKFLRHCLQQQDEDFIDFLASRALTFITLWGGEKKRMADVDLLADYYAALKQDELLFSRRAASVLSRVPAYSISSYNRLVRENRLARLLFQRSPAVYLADPASLSDLVEGAEIHVMALAYRALGLDDPRARAQAAAHLPLLLGTLLRPLQRATRAQAFRAMANAADTLENARLIHNRALEAMNLPDIRYPKEKLLGLIASLLHRWPELRQPGEQPVIYRRAA